MQIAPCHAGASRALHTSPFAHFGHAGRKVHPQYHTRAQTIRGQALNTVAMPSIARRDLHLADPATNGWTLMMGLHIPPSKSAGRMVRAESLPGSNAKPMSGHHVSLRAGGMMKGTNTDLISTQIIPDKDPTSPSHLSPAHLGQAGRKVHQQYEL